MMLTRSGPVTGLTQYYLFKMQYPERPKSIDKDRKCGKFFVQSPDKSALFTDMPVIYLAPVDIIQDVLYTIKWLTAITSAEMICGVEELCSIIIQ